MNCNCPNSSYGTKHSAVCYEARIRDLEAAVETGRTALTVSQDLVRELEAALTTIAEGKYRGVLSDFCRAALGSEPESPNGK